MIVNTEVDDKNVLAVFELAKFSSMKVNQQVCLFVFDVILSASC